MERKDRVFSNEVKPLPDKERILRFVTSSEATDRDGDIIEVAGWQLDNYMKNPVVLFGHDYSDLPVGKTVNIEIDNYNKRLIQDIQFPTKEEYEFGDTVYRMCKSGYLNTTSVGFMGIEHEPILDENKNYVGRRYKKQELLETSIVPVPSNPTALIEARSKGILKDSDMKYFGGDKSMNIEEKAGATLSAKNKKELDDIHAIMKGCGERLRKFLDGCTPGMDEEMDEEEKEVNNEISEIKEALAEIKQVLFLMQKSPEPEQEEKKEDDDEIEDLEEEPELDINEDELEKALNSILDKKINQVKGGN